MNRPFSASVQLTLLVGLCSMQKSFPKWRTVSGGTLNTHFAYSS